MPHLLKPGHALVSKYSRICRQRGGGKPSISQQSGKLLSIYRDNESTHLKDLIIPVFLAASVTQCEESWSKESQVSLSLDKFKILWDI